MSAFNPLPSHEGRRGCPEQHERPDGLSIHFPLTREDGQPRRKPDYHSFQSTSLSRGKTLLSRRRGRTHVLSIHFPLTREDGSRAFRQPLTRTFNPLPSHEGRPQKTLIFFSKAAHFSDITNNNISSNKIAPYLQHFLRYKKLIFSGANLPGNLCSLMVRTILPYKISHSLFKTTTVPSHQIRALLQYALPYFYIGLPNNKNVDCPFLCL